MRLAAMPKKKKVSINVGDVFIIPLEDSVSYGVGVVIEVTPKALNSVLCGFYDLKIESENELNMEDLNEKNLIAVQFVTPDLLKEGHWGIIENMTPVEPNNYLNLNELKSNGYVGAKIRGSCNIRKFMSAYLGVYHWNCFFKDDYLDDFLLYPEHKPERIYFIERC
jgi:hypothetical protein